MLSDNISCNSLYALKMQPFYPSIFSWSANFLQALSLAPN